MKTYINKFNNEWKNQGNVYKLNVIKYRSKSVDVNSKYLNFFKVVFSIKVVSLGPPDITQ